jgi:hypothetical protein
MLSFRAEGGWHAFLDNAPARKSLSTSLVRVLTKDYRVLTKETCIGCML